MVQASDFLQYCAGISMVLLAASVLLRVIYWDLGRRDQPKKPAATTKPRWEPIPDDDADDLNGRLRNFQAARFASPIIRRNLSDDAGPAHRLIGPPRPVSSTWPVQKPRPIPSPGRGKDSPSKVVQLPVKPKKNEEPPKEGA